MLFAHALVRQGHLLTQTDQQSCTGPPSATPLFLTSNGSFIYKKRQRKAYTYIDGPMAKAYSYHHKNHYKLITIKVKQNKHAMCWKQAKKRGNK